MFGKLTWDAIPWDQPIPLMSPAVVVILAVLGVLVWVIVKGLSARICGASGSPASTTSASASCTSCSALVMLLRGFIDALMMRSQQAVAFHAAGYLPPEHYDQIFSAHGTIMIFFAAMPLVIGLMNFVVPLQLGVRDVAFPTLNSTSFWLTATGALLVNLSLVDRRVRAHRLAALSAAVRDRPTRPGSASTITSGRCRFPASAR